MTSPSDGSDGGALEATGEERFAFVESIEFERVGSVDQVARILRAMIADGRLPQGQRLPEIPLSKALGVSRNTLRDAIRHLVAEGLVVHELHRGAIVRTLSASDVRDIYGARRFLELPALAAVSGGSPAARARVRGALAACEATVEAGDYSGFVEQELAFHAGLVAHLGNQRFDDFFKRILGELRLLISDLSSDSEPKTNKRILSHYHRIYSAAERGDVDQAQDLLKQHLDTYESRLLEGIKQRAAGS